MPHWALLFEECLGCARDDHAVACFYARMNDRIDMIPDMRRLRETGPLYILLAHQFLAGTAVTSRLSC